MNAVLTKDNASQATDARRKKVLNMMVCMQELKREMYLGWMGPSLTIYTGSLDVRFLLQIRSGVTDPRRTSGRGVQRTFIGIRVMRQQTDSSSAGTTPTTATLHRTVSKVQS